MEGIFFRHRSQYTDKLNPIRDYLKQLASYIMSVKGCTEEKAKEVALQILRENFKDKQMIYFEREENGDRNPQRGSLLKYIQNNINNENVFVPTFTSYKNGKVEKSIHSEFIFVNVKTRAIAKKEGQKAKAEGLLDLALFKNNVQNSMKTDNNSLSGVYGQQACVLHNPTNHSTLTSITRTITSLSNASNEKLIAGNRFLPRGVDVLNSLVYIVSETNQEAVKKTVEEHNLYLPTVEDVVKVLKYSSDLYFVDHRYYEKHVIPYLNKLTPYHLANICYAGDLYHIRQFNPCFVRDLIAGLTKKETEPLPKLEDVGELHKIDEAILMFAHTIYFSEIKGMGKNYGKMNEAGIAARLLATCNNIVDQLQSHKLFYNTFFMSGILPTNSHRLNDFKRRVVVLSDTDSTCFTMDEWVIWKNGEYVVDDTDIAMVGSLCYIAAQAIVNSLAFVSKNMNIEEELLNTLQMKGEFIWENFIPCDVSKHYFASTIIQEGNVHSESDLECKGVHLKNSAVPKNVIEIGKGLMHYIADTLAKNEKISFNYVVKTIVDLENEIEASVKRGESIYLKKSKIKGKDAYSQDEMKSPYQRHQLWIDVFSPKYGDIGDPPYDVVKIPTTVKKRIGMDNWINSITDLELKERLLAWLTKYNKKELPTMYLNETYLAGSGVPDEIASIVDSRRIIFDMTLQHRTILKTLGVMLNDSLLIREQML